MSATVKAKDPKIILEIFTKKGTRYITHFGVQDDAGKVPQKRAYDAIARDLGAGQPYIILDEDTNPSALMVTADGTIRTTKDNSELNNLRGNTNVKETVADEYE